MEDMSIDKDQAFTDPTGLKLDEEKPGPENDKLDEEKPGSDDDMDMVEQEGTDDPLEEGPLEDLDESIMEETENSAEETLNEGESEKLAGDSKRNDPENKQEHNADMDSVGAKKNEFRSGALDLVNDHAPNGESATQPTGDSQAAALRDVAPEAQWSNCNDTQSDVASMRGLPNSENEIAVADSSKGEKLGNNQPKTELPQLDSSSLQKSQPNPCRNIGDALDGWKERVKVSVDLEDNSGEVPDDMVDENAEEYGFTSEFEKGTAQSLGTATSDQIDGNINGNEPDGDDGTANRNDQSEMEIEDQQRETRPISSHALNLSNRIDEQMEDISKIEKQREGSPEVHNHNDGYQGELNESVVSMRRSYMSNEINQLGKLSVNDDEDLGQARNLEEMSIEMKDNASALWRRYELRTTRLSQELSEQLRLVMEPTLASKLQGDYKTGKRINMKKVIPYIASHYRKDKIWLRRTRPNKRDYQVVIAVDDSRSMSESNCGDVAIEALVTVCRAMSQLEVGSLAVASYGKKGNIRLLHDFDQPFTGEAGVKMLSSLTFKQENTIADEPMVDVLKYLNNMLDDAVAMARLPSGHNPLQQLVLIIADGRFHEKENLKRCVRDLLSKKRMVAFLLLDSPQESILDLMEASFQGGNVKFSKYLDSFPFPFYVVLKNIEALPRTLADLLRQWFELMQYSRD